MPVPGKARHQLWRTSLAAAAAGVVALLAACGSASPAAPSGPKQGAAMPASATASGTAGMPGMPGMTGTAMTGSPSAAGGSGQAGGVSAVPMQVLGTATWQGMKVTAQAMTPVPFLVYNGTGMQPVKPARNASFHLMVLLNDSQTGVVIPYGSVWATIRQGARTPFNGSLWPTISRYMGPHYGNDVSLPGAGTYQLTLLVSPPVSARHLEYRDVWLKPHTVSFTFHWKPVS